MTNLISLLLFFVFETKGIKRKAKGVKGANRKIRRKIYDALLSTMMSPSGLMKLIRILYDQQKANIEDIVYMVYCR